MNVIYRITCVENQKFYIGSTVNKNQRWARHRRELRTGIHKNKNMQASWNKYGEEAFLFEVIQEVAETAQLMAEEQRHLDVCVGKEDCFNHNPFADSPWRGKSGEGTPRWGVKASPEVCEKIRLAVSGENHRNWGKTIPEETQAKIKATNLAYPHKDRRHTPEEIAKIAAASKGRPQSALTRAKRIISMQGHEVSPMTRMKISRSLTGAQNPRFGKPREEGFVEKVSRPVFAVAPAGVPIRYKSISALRAVTGLKPPTLNRALKSREPLKKGPYTGWIFYADVV